MADIDVSGSFDGVKDGPSSSINMGEIQQTLEAIRSIQNADEKRILAYVYRHFPAGSTGLRENKVEILAYVKDPQYHGKIGCSDMHVPALRITAFGEEPIEASFCSLWSVNPEARTYAADYNDKDFEAAKVLPKEVKSPEDIASWIGAFFRKSLPNHSFTKELKALEAAKMKELVSRAAPKAIAPEVFVPNQGQ
jgi:hypothetical protein